MIRKQTHQTKKDSLYPRRWTLYVYDSWEHIVFEKIYDFEANANSMAKKWRSKIEKENLKGYSMRMLETYGCWCHVGVSDEEAQ